MEKKVPRVAIILLNWNSSDDSRECLESLTGLEYGNFDVVMLDNGSKKENVNKMVKYWSEIEPLEARAHNFVKMEPRTTTDEGLPMAVKENPNSNFWNLLLIDKNHGFAEGNNIGIRYAIRYLSPDYVLLLNNDTVVDPAFLDNLIEYSESRPEIGILGPMIYYYDYEGRKDVINMVGGRINLARGSPIHIGANSLDKGQYTEPGLVDYVEGSCMLIKRKVIESIGMFKASYFAYWEETDYCVRAERGGFSVAAVPKAKIWHKVSASVDISTKSYYFYRNRLWFVKDNATTSERVIFCSAYLMFIVWYELHSIVLSKNRGAALHSYLKGTWDGLLESSK